MNIKELKAFVRAQTEERNALPWFFRIPLNAADFFRYQVFSRFENMPEELKLKIQSLRKGYNDYDVRTLGNFIVLKIRNPIREFAVHQAEHGLALPEEFKTDPAKWLEIVKKIEFSVEHQYRVITEPDYNPIKNLGVDEVTEFYKRIDEGFVLLGKHLRDLWD